MATRVQVQRLVPLGAAPGAAAAAVIAVCGALLGREGFALGAFWFIGVAFGVIVQRGRLCFAGGFRDLVMSGDGRILRALLLAIMVSTVGFSFLMARMAPDPAFSRPPSAHIQTVGLATVAGGVIFGIGMVLAGGCVSGTLWRMGEGYLNSWVAMAGILFGLWSGGRTWSWWYDHDISVRRAVWLPEQLGFGWSVVLVVALLGAAYLAVLWWELRSPRLPGPVPRRPEPIFTVADHLRGVWSKLFSSSGWSYPAAALALAVLGVFSYALQAPLGVTGGLGLWADRLASLVHAEALPLKGGDTLAGCTAGSAAKWLTIRSTTMTGLVMGAFLASALSGEFKVRWSRQVWRYPQLVIGGVLMGYASILAVGCTIGAFFSSIPSLALSGWLFGIALLGGAFIGVQVIRRLP